MKKIPALVLLLSIAALAQDRPPSTPVDAVPPQLAGALMDLYMNYQQNKPKLPLTAEEAQAKAERTRERNVKVASGVAIGSAIGALVANPNEKGKATAIGAVAGGVAAWILDHYQVKQAAQAAPAQPQGL